MVATLAFEGGTPNISQIIGAEGPIPGVRSRDGLLPASWPSAYMPRLQARLITLPRECFLIRVLRLVWNLPTPASCQSPLSKVSADVERFPVLTESASVSAQVCCSTFNPEGCEKESNQLERMVRRRKQRN